MKIFSSHILLATSAIAPFAISGCVSPAPETDTRPNIIYFLCDDLGIGELGCYGQKYIQTPNIDRLAQRGMLFQNHYSGSAVCAPSRCVLLTGKHTGHSFIRGNREMKTADGGQLPIPLETPTLAKSLKSAGYATACIGKWGLGAVNTSGDPLKQGFDHFYGYNCQRHAHSYYPAYLWNDSQKVTINGGVEISGHQGFPQKSDPNDPEAYQRYIGKTWTPDLMTEEAVSWITKNKDNPFFLYYATPLPHVPIQVPEKNVEFYHKILGDEAPYNGRNGGYLPTRYPKAGYAAMVKKIDDDVGQLVKTLDELNLTHNTLIIFCSDNGPTFNGGTRSDFFRSARDARGLKCSVYEGGLRVPMIAVWPGKIRPNTQSDLVSAMWDVFPTLCDITRITPPPNLDGVSLCPTLLHASAPQQTHEYLYWENTEWGKTVQAVRVGDYKLVRALPKGKPELFNLKNDPGESKNLAKSMPKKVEELLAKIQATRTVSKEFPLPQK